MSINFMQPKYVFPLLALPFLCLFFYVFHSGGAKQKTVAKQAAGINTSVGDVSPEVKKQDLTDKLDAYRNRYKETDNNNRVSAIPTETSANPKFHSSQAKLDSINRLMNRRFQTQPSGNRQGQQPDSYQMAQALNRLNQRQMQQGNTASTPQDPMALFRQQIAYMDSVRKAADPAAAAERKKQEAQAKADAARAADKPLLVTKTETVNTDFNTVMPPADRDFIKVVIDENTDLNSFRNELRWNDVYYHIAGGLRGF